MKKLILSILTLTTFGLASQAQIPTNGLLCHYPFDGNFDDQAGANNGTNTGCTFVADRHGNASSAIYLDGSTNQVDFGDINLVSPDFTISFWVNYFPITSGSYRVLSKRGVCSTGNFFDINVSSANTTGMELYSGSNNSGNAAGGGDPLVSGNWHNITYVADNANQQTLKYIDGVLASTKNWGTAMGSIDNSTSLKAGYSPCVNGSSAKRYKGYLDDIRVYTRPLDAYEVSLLYYYDQCYGTAKGTDNITACNSYTWIDGNTYTSNNTTATYTYSGAANNGCDSVTTLNLVINNSTTGVDNITTCGSYTWIDGVTYTSTNTTATHTLTNSVMCDSVVTLNLSILTDETITAPTSICQGDSATISLANSYTSAKYTLRDASNTVIDGPHFGTGSALDFNTGAINTATTFNVYAENQTQQPNDFVLEFDGSNDRVITDFSLPTVNQLTIEAWVYPKSGNYDRLISNYSSATSGNFGIDTYHASANNGRGLRFFAYSVSNSLTMVSVPNVLTLNDWNHIAVTFSSGNIKFYVDGVEVHSTSSMLASINGISNPICFGEDYVIGTSEYLNGRMDEVKIWQSARTQNEIIKDMNNCAGGYESDLLLYYSFEEGSGLTTADLVNGTSASLSNMNSTFSWIPGAAPNTCVPQVPACGFTMAQTVTITTGTTNNVTDVQSACNSFTWIDGNVYTSSNNSATHTLTNISGCDSIISLDLTINSNTGTDVQTVCDSLVWIDGNTYTANNTSATHTLTNIAGCDSVVTLDLTVNNSPNSVDDIYACNTYTWIDGVTYTSSNTTATHIIANGGANGCDSTVLLNLVIVEDESVTAPTSVCVGDTAAVTLGSSVIGASYTLNNSQGDTLDGPIVGTGSSIMFNTGAITTDTTLSVHAEVDPQELNNYALDFDGGNDYIDAAIPSGLNYANAYTIEAWVKSPWSSSVQSPLFFVSSAGVDDIEIYRQKGTHDLVVLHNRGNGGTVSGKVFADPPNNVWYHLAVVFNGSTVQVYYDGVSQGNQSIVDPLVTSGTNMYIGDAFSSAWNAISGGSAFDGQLDNYRIWNYARSSTEINADMNACLTGTESGLSAYYDFEDGTGLTATDLVNGNDATLNNMSSTTDWVSSSVSLSCLETFCGFDLSQTVSITTNPILNTTEMDSVCSGSSYTFPDGTTQTGIISQVVYNSTLQSTVTGCDSVVETTVNVNPVYNNTESDNICYGASYTFPDGSTQTNITSQVVHNSTLQTTLGCDSVVETTVDVDPIVDVSVVVLSLNTLTANQAGASYQWLECTTNGYTAIAGATSQSYTVTTSGDYAVEVTVNGCADTSACIPMTITGINEWTSSALTIYPNPATNRLNLKASEHIERVSIYSINGALIMRVTENTQLINIENLSRGLYIAEVETKSGIVHRRFDKE